MKFHNAAFSSLKPYITLIQYSGLFPYNLKLTKNCELKAQLSYFKCSISIIILIIATTILGLALWRASEFDDGYLSAYYWKIVAYISDVFTILQIILQFILCRKIFNIIEKLVIFQQQLFDFGVSNKCIIDFQKSCENVRIVTFVVFTAMIIYSISFSAYSIFINFMGSSYFFYVHIGLVFEFIYGYINVIQFATVTSMITKEINCLNLHLQSFNDRISTEKIKKFFNLFRKVVETLRCTNGNIAELLNTTIAITLINVIFCCYSWCTILYYSLTNFITVDFFTSSGIWMIFHIIRVVVVCYYGALVASSFDKTKNKLFDLISNSNNEIFCNEIRNILIQVELNVRKVENSFFVMDWRLIFSVRNSFKISSFCIPEISITCMFSNL